MTEISSTAADMPPDGKGRLRLGPRLLAIALIVAVAGGVGATVRFVMAERDRDLYQWQKRLGTVADARGGAVDQWIGAQFATLQSLSENTALQIYFTELMRSGGDRRRVTEEPAQLSYLRNLLIAAANEGKFVAKLSGPDVPANVRRLGDAGLALSDNDGRVIVSTPNMPPVEGGLAEFVRNAPRGRPAFRDVEANAAGTPAIAVLTPILALQGGGTDQVGWVLGVKPLGPDFFALLAAPPLEETTAETVLVREEAAAVGYISPLKDGSRPMQRTMARDTPELDAAFALTHPGGFAIKRDYRGTEVLAVSRAIAGAPWILVHKVDRAEALKDTDSRLRRLSVVLLLGVAGIGAAFVAVWRHGASIRARDAATRFEVLAEKFEAQSHFLRHLTDSMRSSIHLISGAGRVRFANRTARQRAGAGDNEIVGMAASAVLGPDAARRVQQLNERAQETGATQTELRREAIEGRARVFESEHIPIVGGIGEEPATLVIERDVTDAVTERERRQRTLNQLVSTLTTLLDRRDPNAAEHSVRTGAVARAIATEMGLDRVSIETAETAGTLLNLGKILVPAELLTKADQFSDTDLEQVRSGILASADLVEGVEFDGPVAATLRQAEEHWDGTGHPERRKGEDILITARIVAVANAFVAMVSPRAHRNPMTVDQALDTLLAQTGETFDRRVVAALINYLDNRGGRAQWLAAVQGGGRGIGI